METGQPLPEPPQQWDPEQDAADRRLKNQERKERRKRKRSLKEHGGRLSHDNEN